MCFHDNLGWKVSNENMAIKREIGNIRSLWEGQLFSELYIIQRDFQRVLIWCDPLCSGNSQNKEYK